MCYVLGGSTHSTQYSPRCPELAFGVQNMFCRHEAAAAVSEEKAFKCKSGYW